MARFYLFPFVKSQFCLFSRGISELKELKYTSTMVAWNGKQKNVKNSGAVALFCFAFALSPG